MKARSIVPLIIGLGVGVFAIKMGVDMVAKAKAEQGGEQQVLLAAKQIGVAARISPDMLTSKKMATALVPPDAFTSSKALVGRVTKTTIPAGVAVTNSMLAPPGAEPGLRAKIPPGYRAVSVKVNEATAVAGFVMPGARVDVFALKGAPNGRGSGTQLLSEQILADAEVGAVGQTLSEVAPDGKTVMQTKSVTLFVQPEQVPALHAATSKGEVRLALRGIQGGDDEEKKPSVWRGLFSHRATPVKPVVVRSQHTVEVVRGQTLQTLVFDEDGRLEKSSMKPLSGACKAGEPENDAGVE